MGKASTGPVKGTRDFLPEDVRRRDHVTAVIRGVFEAHGFEPLETPALERLESLLGKYGDEGDQLLFKVLLRGQPFVHGVEAAARAIAAPGAVIEGRSGRTAPGVEPLLSDMGLRYDLTVPLARVAADNRGKLPQVFKRYQIQPVWRADTPGKGRFREFYQCDVDVIGSTEPIVEVEVLGAAALCMQGLGFADFSMRINHRALLRAMIEAAGIPSNQEADALVSIDKLDKIGRDGVARELGGRGIPEKAAADLLDTLSTSGDLEAVAAKLSGHPAVDELHRVLDLAGRTAAGPHLAFDATLARGLGYYTGCIFEINVVDLAGSLGGGGRYDGLIGSFSGRDVPACGLSLGLERILVVMAERDMYPASLSPLHAVLGSADATGLVRALETARDLRRAGLNVDLRPDPIKPGKLRQLAETRGVPGAAWIEGGALHGWTRTKGISHALDVAALTALLSPGDAR